MARKKSGWIACAAALRAKTKPRALAALRLLVLYLDDLLLLGAGACFVAAAAHAGAWAALAAAGVCLAVYALLIARARKRGKE